MTRKLDITNCCRNPDAVYVGSRSICHARIDSSSFEPSVLGRGSSSRAVCMVIVEPPDTMRPLDISDWTARASATTSTPEWERKRLSS